jgi:hypothetical protein
MSSLRGSDMGGCQCWLPSGAQILSASVVLDLGTASLPHLIRFFANSFPSAPFDGAKHSTASSVVEFKAQSAGRKAESLN